MRIVDHRLTLNNGTPVRYLPSPNVGGALNPKYLVMHYTAGRNAQESIGWLCSPKSEASAHLVIARDGTVTQLVPFNRIAWHAGKSAWKGLVSLNRYSIGIELDNPGPVKRVNGRWRAYFGKEYENQDVITGFHKLDKVTCGWVTYTAEQLAAALDAAQAIVGHYGLEDVIGHDDISPTRKTDPGPAFDLADFRARVKSGSGVPSRFITTTVLKIRKGPGMDFSPLPESPLPKDTPVEIRARSGPWRMVDVQDPVNKANGLQGWVHFKYLQSAPANT